MKKTADTLERGDVIRPYWPSRELWVVVEPSDHVSTAPPDHNFDGVLAHDCCEPSIVKLGKTTRATHEFTYVIFPNAKRFTIVGFLDLDIRSAVMVPA